MRPRPPAIPPPTKRKFNLGLVSCLADIHRGCYADVIAQVVSSTLSDQGGHTCLVVWDGSEWPHEYNPIFSLDSDERRDLIKPLPQLKEKSRGRRVTILSYDFEKHCVNPLRSGDWVYIQNVHCNYTNGSKYARLVMHDSHERFIWRLDLPMHEGLFYEKQWKTAIERTQKAQPLPFVPQPQQRRAAFAPAAAKGPAFAALDRLATLILSGALQEGIRIPTDRTDLEQVSKVARDAMKIIQSRRATAAAAAAASAPRAARPKSRTLADVKAALAAAATQPVPAAVIAAAPAAAAVAAAPGIMPAPAAAARPRPARMVLTSPSTSGRAPVITSPPLTRGAAAAAAELAAELATSPSANLRKRPAAATKEEDASGGGGKKHRNANG